MLTISPSRQRRLMSGMSGVSIIMLIFIGTQPSFPSDNNVKTLSHFSHFLNKEQKLNVCVPGTPGKHSVLYLLHGATGDYSNWAAKTPVANIAEKYDLIVVMPDGGPYSWYADSPINPESQYESYVVKELIPFVDSAFATFPGREGRGVCGLSMGGYGAIKLGLKYPALFSSASSMSGVLAIQRHPEKWSLTKVFGELKEHPENWQNADLSLLLASCKDTVAIKFDTGIADITLEDNREFLTALQKAHWTFEYGEFPGGHSWSYWGGHLEDHLRFHNRLLRHEDR